MSEFLRADSIESNEEEANCKWSNSIESAERAGLGETEQQPSLLEDTFDDSPLLNSASRSFPSTFEGRRRLHVPENFDLGEGVGKAPSRYVLATKNRLLKETSDDWDSQIVSQIDLVSLPPKRGHEEMTPTEDDKHQAEAGKKFKRLSLSGVRKKKPQGKNAEKDVLTAVAYNHKLRAANAALRSVISLLAACGVNANQERSLHQESLVLQSSLRRIKDLSAIVAPSATSTSCCPQISTVSVPE